ncbi:MULTISPECIES: hypothetical protein [unclassified Curtobacterium]|uniref:hypothetical protein n=1 Tax=unclassified Curtobacterium TaxID=257496 RepID=UPI003818AEB1
MKISRSMITLSTAAALVAATTISAAPAMAADSAPEAHVVASASASTALHYSDRDIVDFLVFGRGPIATEQPELLKSMNITTITEASASVTDRLLTDLKSVDPAFHDRVTAQAQAGDPYKAEASIKAFTEDISAVAAKYQVTQKTVRAASTAATANGQVYAFANYVVSVQVAVAASLAVSVIGVVAALAVFAYQKPGDSSAIAREGYASSWASL